MLRDKDNDEFFEIISAEDEDDAFEISENKNVGAKAVGIRLLKDEEGRLAMYKKGGKVKGRKVKYTYIPNKKIAYIILMEQQTEITFIF